jgi:beta-lactamase superfamily II metal-dependent hydrolase
MATRGDGNLYVTFISIGQGDCTMVSCPNGKTMMIDCGTSRWDTDYNRRENRNQSKADQEQQSRVLRQEVIDTVYEDRFLKGYNTLDVLVLTHPDQDHCNEVASVLKGDITIKNVYHSSILGKYIAGSAEWFLTKRATVSKVSRITVNQTKKEINDVRIGNATAGDKIDKISTDAATAGFIQILDGTKEPGKSCGVYILASNVISYPGVQDESDAEGKNRGSIVVLIIYGTKKIMLAGDATFNTEKFLIDTYGAKINNLFALKASHHGSSVTSSSAATDTDANINAIDFVNKVKPERLYIHAATDSGASLKLPRYEALKKYVDSGGLANIGIANHTVTCWWYETVLEEKKDGDGKVVKRRSVSHPEWGDKDFTTYVVSTGTGGTYDIELGDANV